MFLGKVPEWWWWLKLFIPELLPEDKEDAAPPVQLEELCRLLLVAPLPEAEEESADEVDMAELK